MEKSDGAELILVPPLNGGYGWVVVFAAMMISAIIDGSLSSFGVFFQEIMEEFQISRAETATAGAVSVGCSCIIGGLVTIFLLDTLSTRTCIILMSVLSCIALVVASQAKSFGLFVMFYGVFGGGFLGSIMVSAIVQVSAYFTTKRSLALGFLYAGASAGIFAFGPLSGFLMQLMNWRSVLLLCAGFALQSCVFGALVRPLEDNFPIPVHLERHQKQTPSISGELKLAAIPLQLTKEVGIQNNMPSRAVSPYSPRTNPSDMSMSLYRNILIKSFRNPEIDETSPAVRNSIRSQQDMQSSEQHSAGSANNSISPSVHWHYRRKPKAHRSLVEFVSYSTRSSSPDFLPSGVTNATTQTYRKFMPLRPTHRKDMFYSGSLKRLPEFQSKTSIYHYLESVVSLPETSIIDVKSEFSTDNGLVLFRQRLYCALLRLKHLYYDKTLLFNWQFDALTLAFATQLMGNVVIYFYVDDILIYTTGDANAKGENMLIFAGLSGTIGRFLPSAIEKISAWPTLTIQFLFYLLATIFCFVVPFCADFIAVAVAICIICANMAATHPMIAYILAERYGIEKLNSAFSIGAAFRGTTTFIGPILTGMWIDRTRWRAAPAVLCGLCHLISALCTLAVAISDSIKRVRNEFEPRANNDNSK